MRSPLLLKTTPPQTHRWHTSLFFFIFSFGIFVLYLHSNSGSRAQYASEKAVGVTSRQFGFVTTYFTMGQYADNMKPHMNYRGRSAIRLVPFENFCGPNTPYCDEICSKRSKGIVTQEPVCRSRADERMPLECWLTKDMRCWGLDKLVWDGMQEWIVMAEDLSLKVGIEWIHFMSTDGFKTHLFLFGRGKLAQSYEDMMSKILLSSEIMKELESCKAGDNYLFAGHSQGAGWAAAMNLVMARSGVSQEHRFTIGTGAPLATNDFQQQWNSEAGGPGTSVFFLLGIASPQEVVADIYPIYAASEVGLRSMPQFAYICIPGQVFQCVDPQPLQQMVLSKTVQQLRRGDTVITSIHDFNSYKKCYLACVEYFARIRGDFSPNIAPFTLKPQTTFSRPFPPGPKGPRGSGPPRSGSPLSGPGSPSMHSSTQAGPSTQGAQVFHPGGMQTAARPPTPTGLQAGPMSGGLYQPPSAQAGPSTQTQPNVYQPATGPLAQTYMYPYNPTHGQLMQPMVYNVMPVLPTTPFAHPAYLQHQLPGTGTFVPQYPQMQPHMTPPIVQGGSPNYPVPANPSVSNIPQARYQGAHPQHAGVSSASSGSPDVSSRAASAGNVPNIPPTAPQAPIPPSGVPQNPTHPRLSSLRPHVPQTGSKQAGPSSQSPNVPQYESAQPRPSSLPPNLQRSGSTQSGPSSLPPHMPKSGSAEGSPLQRALVPASTSSQDLRRGFGPQRSSGSAGSPQSYPAGPSSPVVPPSQEDDTPLPKTVSDMLAALNLDEDDSAQPRPSSLPPNLQRSGSTQSGPSSLPPHIPRSGSAEGSPLQRASLSASASSQDLRRGFGPHLLEGSSGSAGSPQSYPVGPSSPVVPPSQEDDTPLPKTVSDILAALNLDEDH